MPGRRPEITDQELLQIVASKYKFDLLIKNEKSGEMELRKELDPVWEDLSAEILRQLNKNIKRKTLYLRFKKDTKKILISTLKSDQNKYSEKSPYAALIETAVARTDVDSIEELLDLENDVVLKPMFREIAAEPSFYVSYRCPEGIHIWKKMYEINRSMIFRELNVQKKIYYVNVHKLRKEVAAYELQTFMNNQNVPIFHTVVDVDYARDKTFFENFFRQWLEEKLLPPEQLVMPSNLNIVKAALSSFNHQSLSQYINECFKLIINEELNSSTPICVLKFNIGTLLMIFFEKNVSHNNQENFVLKYCVCCFYYIAKIYSVDEFFDAVNNVLILLISQNANELTTKARNSLNSKISEDLFVQAEQIINNPHFDRGKIDILDSDYNNDISQHLWNNVKTLYRDCDVCSKNSNSVILEPNNFKNEKLMSQTINLLSLFPMWTNILSNRLTTFCEVTSGLQFNDLVTNQDAQLTSCLDRTCKPKDANELSVENYVQIHADFIKTILQETRQIVRSLNLGVQKDDPRNVSLHSYLQYSEEWRGKAATKMFELEEFDPEMAMTDAAPKRAHKRKLEENFDLTMESNATYTPNSFNDTSFSQRLNSTALSASCLQSDRTEDHVQSSDINTSSDHSYSLLPIKKIITNEKSGNGNIVFDVPFNRQTATINRPRELQNYISIKNFQLPIEPPLRKTKRPAKYTDPCPYAEYMFDSKCITQSTKNKRRKHTATIMNGNFLIPRKNAKPENEIFFTNTSPIDAVLEVFMSAHYYFPLFQKFCKNSNNYFQTVQKLCESGNQNLYTKERRDILLKIGEHKMDTIYCKKNIAEYLDKFMQNEFCLKIVSFCSTCKKLNSQKVASIKIRNSNLKTDNNLLNSYFDVCENDCWCSKCSEKINCTVEYELGHLVIFDIQEHDKRDKLGKIQKKIAHKSQIFILAGVISFEPGKTENIHYVAYCHNVRGSGWTKKDNKMKKCTASDNTAVRIALIIYVRMAEAIERDSTEMSLSTLPEIIEPVVEILNDPTQHTLEKIIELDDTRIESNMMDNLILDKPEFTTIENDSKYVEDGIFFNSEEFANSSFQEYNLLSAGCSSNQTLNENDFLYSNSTNVKPLETANTFLYDAPDMSSALPEIATSLADDQDFANASFNKLNNNNPSSKRFFDHNSVKDDFLFPTSINVSSSDTLSKKPVRETRGLRREPTENNGNSDEEGEFFDSTNHVTELHENLHQLGQGVSWKHNLSSSPPNRVSFETSDEICHETQEASSEYSKNIKTDYSCSEIAIAGTFQTARTPKDLVPCKTYKIITNGNRLAKRNVKNIFYTYEDTSRFDALMEVIVRAFDSNKYFMDFFLQNTSRNDTGFMQAVINYSRENNTNFLYKYRWSILFEKRIESVNINNVVFSSDLIGKYCQKLMKLESICKTCKNEYNFDNFIIEADVDIKNFSDLSRLLKPIETICACGEVIKNCSKFIGIDLETKYLRYQIEKIPTFISARSKIFNLAGVVGLPVYGDKISHYIAYCYERTTATWLECDNNKKKVGMLNIANS